MKNPGKGLTLGVRGWWPLVVEAKRRPRRSRSASGSMRQQSERARAGCAFVSSVPLSSAEGQASAACAAANRAIGTRKGEHDT